MSAAEVVIRPYHDHDEPAVVALWSEVFPNPAPRNEPRFVLRTKRAVQGELLFVADRTGTIVGTAMTGFDGRRGWVYAVAVDPRHRRGGIGRALMARVERELAVLGCPKVNLQVEGRNAGVVDFYTALGFAVEDRISMGKVLESDV